MTEKSNKLHKLLMSIVAKLSSDYEPYRQRASGPIFSIFMGLKSGSR